MKKKVGNMSALDLLRMSLSSLWRRKMRTILTALGVVIGVASVVVMISIGLGLTRASMETIERYGGLTTIEVRSSQDNYYYYGMDDSNNKDQEPMYLDDDAVAMLASLDHVVAVEPQLSLDCIAKCNGYESYLQVVGTTPEALAAKNLVVGQGKLPTSDNELEFFYGNTVITNFYKAKTNEYYWETGVLPDIDFMEDPIFVVFNMDAYWNAQYGGVNEDGSPVQAPKKYIIKTAGVLAGGPEDWNSEASYMVYCDIEALKTVLRKEFKGQVIPGQPNKNGKPYKQIFYNMVNVRVDDMKYMEEVQSTIKGIGYSTYSNSEWIQQERAQSKNTQRALGGIGAVALLVAAIGIANTMTMSIYERTKEIGVMKVLGCDMPNIRNMFLAEAGFIGLMGGVAGLILSYVISAIINHFSATDMGSGISYIPPWLALSALVFAVIVGMVSGFFPSLRAMRLSPLAAISNQ